jgi:hypothetical protein
MRMYKNVLSRRKSNGLQDRLYRRYHFPQVIIICKGHTLSLITQAMTSQENNGLNRRAAIKKSAQEKTSAETMGTIIRGKREYVVGIQDPAVECHVICTR